MSVALLTRAVVIGDDPDVLATIREPRTHIAVWRRERPAAMAWLDTYRLTELDSIDLPIEVKRLDTDVMFAMAQAGYPQDQRIGALVGAVASLVRRFAAIMVCDHVRLRLDIVTTDACRKFHMDMVTARLLSTLSGAGTQWIEVKAPERSPDEWASMASASITRSLKRTAAAAIAAINPIDRDRPVGSHEIVSVCV